MLQKDRKIVLPGNKQQGFGIIEIMISMTIGFVVLAGVISFFSTSIKGSTDSLLLSSVNQDLRSVMNIMRQELRRSGYWAKSTSDTDNPYGFQIINENCILYSYDTDNTDPTGVSFPEEKELFGFRLSANGTIDWLRGGNDCSTHENWKEVSDSNLVIVDNLTYHEPPASCTNISAIPRNNCNPYDCDYTPWQDGDISIEVQQIEISLIGKAKKNDDIIVTLADSLRVRNEKVVTKLGKGPNSKASNCS